jgi:CheY-like chemotaxis protein
LIYKIFVPSTSLIQVGTFLATIDFEEGMSMIDSHLPASKRTIMVVDDDPEPVDILRITLESKGFNVRCAYSGRELFASLEEQKPDLILLDIMMPKMDGLEVLTRLKGDPNTTSIPVIMLTAKSQDVDVTDFILRTHPISMKGPT